MQFRTWVEQIENPVILVKREYLFDLGMSAARVRGEVVRAMDKIEGDQVTIEPGQLGVLLDTSSVYYTVAITMGIFGFHPIRTEGRFWEKTGQHFDEERKKVDKMSDDSMQVVTSHDLKDIEDQLRQYPQVTGVFVSDKQIRATLYTPPKGPSGYSSDYQVIINSGPTLTVIAVVKGETRTIKSDLENLPKVVQAAVMFISQTK